MLEACRARSPRSARRTAEAEVFGRPESVTVTHGVQGALFLLFEPLLRPRRPGGRVQPPMAAADGPSARARRERDGPAVRTGYVRGRRRCGCGGR